MMMTECVCKNKSDKHQLDASNEQLANNIRKIFYSHPDDIFSSCFKISSLISSGSGISSGTQASEVLGRSLRHVGHDLLPVSFHCSMQSVQNECKQFNITSGFRSMHITQQSSSSSVDRSLKLNRESFMRFRGKMFPAGELFVDFWCSSLADIASIFIVMVLNRCRNCFRFIILIFLMCRVSVCTVTIAIFTVAFHSHWMLLELLWITKTIW